MADFPESQFMNASSQAEPPGPDFSKNAGLVAAVAQDAASGEVLMVAWMNAEAYAETLRTGRAVYFSRSRGKLWRKGEESGHVQTVRAIYVDCADRTDCRWRVPGETASPGEDCHSTGGRRRVDDVVDVS